MTANVFPSIPTPSTNSWESTGGRHFQQTAPKSSNRWRKPLRDRSLGLACYARPAWHRRDRPLLQPLAVAPTTRTSKSSTPRCKRPGSTSSASSWTLATSPYPRGRCAKPSLPTSQSGSKSHKSSARGASGCREAIEPQGIRARPMRSSSEWSKAIGAGRRRRRGGHPPPDRKLRRLPPRHGETARASWSD